MAKKKERLYNGRPYSEYLAEQEEKKKERARKGNLSQRDKMEIATARAKRKGLVAVKTPEGFDELTLEQAELTPSVAEQERLGKLKLQEEETIKKLQEGAEKPLEKEAEEKGFLEKLKEAGAGEPKTSAELAEMQKAGTLMSPEEEEFRKGLAKSAITTGVGLGLGIGMVGKIGKARAALSKLNKWEGIKLFGFSIKLKEIVAGAAIFSQDVARRLIKNINGDATKLGTERNEKIARWMISGLHPDKAIELYQQDKDYLMEARDSVQLYRIFYLWDWVASDADTVQLNIQNQIDAKDSRIAEAEKFKLGITTAEIQRMIMEAEGEVENVV